MSLGQILHNIGIYNEQFLKIVKQDRQCTYDVTMRYVRATIVAVEKQ